MITISVRRLSQTSRDVSPWPWLGIKDDNNGLGVGLVSQGLGLGLASLGLSQC